MKKLILILVIIVVSVGTVFAADYNYKAKNIYYNQQTSTWNEKKQSENDISLIYKGGVGSGGFSEYYYENGKLAIGPCTNVEFVADGELIGINGHDLKFVKYTYNNGQVTSRYLSDCEIKELYPDHEILKISQFKDNEIIVNKKVFTKKRILLLNDTKNSFYKYGYKPSSVNRSGVSPFVKLSHPGKVVFSHYGSDTEVFPALKIYVKNKIKTLQ